MSKFLSPDWRAKVSRRVFTELFDRRLFEYATSMVDK
jgi:hypothetical protein